MFVCKDINIKFLIKSSFLTQLTDLLSAYCIKRTSNEPTRVTMSCALARLYFH